MTTTRGDRGTTKRWSMIAGMSRPRGLVMLGVDYHVFRLAASAVHRDSPWWAEALGLAVASLATALFLATATMLWTRRRVAGERSMLAATFSLVVTGLHVIEPIGAGRTSWVDLGTYAALLVVVCFWVIELTGAHRARGSERAGM